MTVTNNVKVYPVSCTSKINSISIRN